MPKRTMLKDLQLPLRNGEHRETALKTDHELRKDKHHRFVQTFTTGKMDGNFAAENALLI